MVGSVSTPFLCEHETEMYGSQLPAWFSSLHLPCASSVICRFQLLHLDLVYFTASTVLMSTVRDDHKVSCFLPTCACGCRCKVVGRGRCGMSSLPGSLPLATLLSWPPLREGFFRSLCPFCLFLSARVFRLVCIPYTHAAHSPSLSRYLKTPRTGSGFILLPSLSCQRSFVPVFPLSCPPLLPMLSFSTILSCCLHCISFKLSDCRVSPRLQLYGEYREQLGNFARREAARLLTERQWRRQAGDNTAAGRKGHGRRHHHHHHHHSVNLESHHSHSSSSKKPRPYSKCQGDNGNEEFPTHIETLNALQKILFKGAVSMVML